MKKTLNNYHPISLLSTVYKFNVYSIQVFMDRIIATLDSNYPREQVGLCSGSSTTVINEVSE